LVQGRTQGTTKGLSGRKRSLLEGGIRVPGIIEWPKKIPTNTVVQNPCFTSDYFPTIAHILGIDLKKYNRPYDGVDLMPFITNKEKTRSKPLAFEYKKQAALIDGNYKIYSAANGKTFRLYNIKEDPSATNNIAANHKEKLNTMILEWNTWKTSQENSNKGNDY
jgi:arylsulfatase A-like enzyme